MNTENADLRTLKKMIMTMTQTMHIIGGEMTGTWRRSTDMYDHCMNDIFEQCFHDCPNCPQNGLKSGLYLDENDRIYDDEDEGDDLYYGD